MTMNKEQMTKVQTVVAILCEAGMNGDVATVAENIIAALDKASGAPAVVPSDTGVIAISIVEP